MKNHFNFPLLCGLFFFSHTIQAQFAGTADFSFGQNGTVLLSTPNRYQYAGTLCIQSDGKIISTGYQTNQSDVQYDIIITRMLPDGTPDPTYGFNGQVRIDYQHLENFPTASAIQPDDKLIIAGNFYDSIDYNSAFVMRLNPDGKFDSTFNQTGIQLFNLGDNEDIFNSIKILPDGKILAGGDTYDTDSSSGADLLLVQLNPDGSLDNSFGTNGISKKSFSNGDYLETITSLDIQADGKIVAACIRSILPSSPGVYTPHDARMIRFNPNGSVDAGFAGPGGLSIDFGPQSDDIAFKALVQPDQKLLVSGSRIHGGIDYAWVYRLNTDGTYDNSFGNNNGRAIIDIGSLELAQSIALQPDGKILVSVDGLDFSGSGWYAWLLRMMPNGQLDDVFGANGIVWSSPFADFAEATSLLLQPDGKILMSGAGGVSGIVWRFENDIVATKETGLESFKVSIAPNPVSDCFHLRWESSEEAVVQADLFDLQGRLVRTLVQPDVFYAGKNHIQAAIPPECVTGSYFLRLRIGSRTGLFELMKI